jgi:hypothetical protein
MKAFKFLIVLNLIMLSFSAHSQWTTSSTVLEVYAHNQYGGYGIFRLEDMGANPSNCTDTRYYVLSKENNPVFNEIYSTLLAAHMSGKKAQVWVSGCSPHNHILIQHARIIQ